MYGYVRPVKQELRIGEYEQFRAVYCGLCEALQRRCGFLARFVVNYDLTFLAMLLSGYEGCMQRKRCPAHPFRKRYCLCGTAALDAAADYSVILAWWKLKDDIQDKSFWKGLVYRPLTWMLKPSYRKAAAAQPAFDETTRLCLCELSELEQQNSSSLDQTADCFARILAAASNGLAQPMQRVMRELFYHVGRYVYLLDAIDDLSKDWKTGAYNPLIHRFALKDGKLRPEDKEELQATLNISQQCIAAAFQFLEDNPWHAILENTICLGLPLAAEKVLSGQWNKREKGKEIIPVTRRNNNV